MKKIILRIIAALTAFLLIGFIVSIANAFVGNPLSKAIATHKINAYVNENFSDMDYELSKTSYNFKNSDYYVKAQSKTSVDTHFNLSYSNGKVTDSYEDDVLGGWNTFQRLDAEFNDVIESLIENKMPYDYDMIIGTLDKNEDSTFDILPLDIKFDISNLPLDGVVTIYLYTDDVSWENVAKVSLELDELMKTNHIKVKQYDVILKPNSEKEVKTGESLGIYEFPSEMLEQDNLPKVMEEYFTNWETAGEAEKNAEINNAK